MGNVYMEASQINYRGGEKKMSVEEALKNTSGEAAAIAQLQADVSNLSGIKANQITIAPTFSAETSYDPGDIVYYNGLSYRCVNAHEGEWDSDDFASTTISNELASLMSGLANYAFTDSITTHGQWTNTSIIDLSIYSGRVIYGYMTDTTLGRTYTFAMPVSNMPSILAPIWVQHDPSDMSNNDAILVAKEVSTNQLLIYLGSNIPDMTLYLFVH